MPDFTDLIMKIRNSGLSERKKAELERRLIREGPWMDIDRAIDEARGFRFDGISIPLTRLIDKIPKRLFISRIFLLKLSLWAACFLCFTIVYPNLTKTIDSLENSPPIGQPKPKESAKEYGVSYTPPSPEPTPTMPTYKPPSRPVDSRLTAPAKIQNSAIRPKPNTKDSGKWYVGGTLHQADVSDWWRASESNRLATCGDFISALILEGKLNIKFSDVDDLLPYAYQLMTCINATTRNFPKIQKARVKEIAGLCVVGSGWWKK